MLRVLEEGIVKLVDAFLAKPYLFYTESDLHCYLYHTLWNLGLNRGCRMKVDGRTVESALLHRVPHKEQVQEAPRQGARRGCQGKRGHFDLCVWDQR